MKNLANNYIQKCIDKNKYVSIFLVNGVQLKGYISDLDEESLILTKKGYSESQIVFKTAISTIMPINLETHKRAYNVKNTSLQAC